MLDPRLRALSFCLLNRSASQFPPLSLPDPFLIVLFLPQSPPMPLFHPPSLQPALSLPGSFSPGRTFTLSESEQNGRGREKEEHTWGQRRQAEKNRQRSAMLAGRQAKGNNITALCGEAEKCICVNASSAALLLLYGRSVLP